VFAENGNVVGHGYGRPVDIAYQYRALSVYALPASPGALPNPSASSFSPERTVASLARPTAAGQVGFAARLAAAR
jgi:hypothetical protein